MVDAATSEAGTGTGPPARAAAPTAEPDLGHDRLGQLDAVHALTAATVAATSVECIYQAALDALVRALGVDRAAVLLFDADGVMRFKASRGLSERYRRATEGHTPWALGDSAPEPVTISDAATDEGLGELRPVVLGEGIRALAFVPLLYGRRLLGKFMLYRDRPHHFGAAELALARTVAGHIAFALEQRRLEDELRLSAETLAATLDAVGEGITVVSPDGRLLLANEAAAVLLGYASAKELLGATASEVLARFEVLDEEGRPLAPERLPGRAALRGEEPPEVLVRWRAADSGSERFSLVRAHPVKDQAGDVRFAVNVFRDVTQRQRAMEALRASEARLDFLATASRELLSTPLQPGHVLAQVVDLVVPELADWCSVREMVANSGPDRVALGHRDPAAAEVASALEAYGGLLAAGPALSSGRAVVVADVSAATPQDAAGGPVDHEALRRLGVRSAIVAPLRSSGEVLGVLTLGAGAGRRAYTPADSAMVEELASRVASTLSHARSFAREQATAETLARALLPGRLPALPGLELAARYRAAGDVGGDFYDCFATDFGGWMLVIGDVCGRGIEAASITGLTRHSIRAAALHASSPAKVLADVNRLLLVEAGRERGERRSRDRSDPSFCTACVVAVVPTAGGARGMVATAGHPLPVLVRSSGEVAEVGRPGSLLGIIRDIDVAEVPFELGPADSLVLLTDGIVERREGGRFFEPHLPAVLASAAGATAASVARALEEAAVGFSAAPPQDDMAVMVLSVPALGDGAESTDR